MDPDSSHVQGPVYILGALEIGLWRRSDDAWPGPYQDHAVCMMPFVDTAGSRRCALYTL